MKITYKKWLPQIMNEGVKINKKVLKILLLIDEAVLQNMTTSPKKLSIKTALPNEIASCLISQPSDVFPIWVKCQQNHSCSPHTGLTLCNFLYLHDKIVDRIYAEKYTPVRVIIHLYGSDWHHPGIMESSEYWFPLLIF